ncbi:hypothetical protein BH11BAC1_BH11BAC1_05660 [soil metagenome]
MFDETVTVNNNASYNLSGADRFQLFFDSVARKNTGTGSVIRAAVTIAGIFPEEGIYNIISQNEAIRFMLRSALLKKWYSPLFRLVQKNTPDDPITIINFHRGELPEEALQYALSRDCSLVIGSPVFIDVIYDSDHTQIIFSVNHVLMDHAGMENLLASFSETKTMQVTPLKPLRRKFILKRVADAIVATLFVAAISGWNLKRLNRKPHSGTAAFEKLELTVEETTQTKTLLTNEIKVNALSFFLGAALHALDINEELLAQVNGNYFVAVPIDRRSAALKNVILSNYLSFIYFHAESGKAKSVKDISESISRQMIAQAKRGLPEKFSSLLDVFRFIPAPIYSAFINLPSNGHSGTFAFSLLTNSRLENLSFLGHPVIDVAHYAPVISPPGLNIVFNEFRGRLKIILSFDDSRIDRLQAKELLQTIRRNLLG